RSGPLTLNERLLAARLYLVTPGEPPAGPLDEFLPRVLEAGVDIVQLRDKHLEARPLLEFAAVVRRRTLEFGALFLVNDRVDLAIAAEADGVHVGQQDLSPAEARRQMGPQALIGLSTHAPGEILDAASSSSSASSEADYIAVGPVYATPTKPGRPAVGPDLLRFAAERAAQPFFAIGGVDAGNLAEVLAAGARRIAVVRALTEAADPGAAARWLSQALRTTPLPHPQDGS
ncbi:MAG: thiE, partial [Actinobacteria bacterium]|nr:thiE [Actinomycetota bacterium]